MSINRIRLEFKVVSAFSGNFKYFCINRIRLEFKGYSEAEQMAAVISINRIRLEFKVLSITAFANTGSVLIESDWNLKLAAALALAAASGINRIRLEFKERYGTINDRWSGQY